jgi:phosphoribosylamine--glycine ligase
VKILIISDWGGALSLSLQFQREGHDTRMWIKDPNYADVGDGMIPKVRKHEEFGHKADFVLCDDIGLAGIAAHYRNSGTVVWGGTDYSDKLELDRGFAQNEFRDAGLSVLSEQSFKNIEEAVRYVEQNPARYVFKPNGSAQEEKILTYVGRAEDGSDLLTLMRHLARSNSGAAQSFQLQKFESGVEIGISGFFNGQDFVEPIELSFEHKKLMTGDIGPATFEMGTTLLWTNKLSRLYRETIGRMVTKLRGYTGYFDINCICHDQHIYPLEATCRFGYPTLYVNMEGLRPPFGETMFRVARGEFVNFETSAQIAACVVIATPPWPYTSPEVFAAYGANSLVIVGGADGTDLPEGIYPAELQHSNGSFYTAGGTGFTCVVAAHGTSIEEVRAEAYNRVGRINIANMMYRTDIGSLWHADISRLREWCWLDC